MVIRLLCGDALEVLRSLPAESVQCCVTSPPYWGLRDYGVAGQLGLERTPEEYVARMVEVFREVRRVLRDDGTLWLNLGDSYAGSGMTGGTASKDGGAARVARMFHGNRRDTVPELAQKQLIGIPWRVAFALQADGWYLRSDIIWAKPNPMPESVTDRPTKAHEYLFLLTKSQRYYYNAGAIKEPCQSGPSDVRKMVESLPRIGGKHKELIDPLSKASAATNIGRKRSVGNPDGRNARTVWTIPTQPFPGAHFAVMPDALVEPCIAAGSREGDAVLDPFAGSGTVGVVCARAGRHFVGIELKSDYVEMARRRIEGTVPLFAEVTQ